MKLKDLKYRLLSHILWGRKQQHYKRKWKDAKSKSLKKKFVKLSRLFPTNTLTKDIADLSELQIALKCNDYAGIYVMGSCEMGWFEIFKQRHHHIAEYLMKQNFLIICAMNPLYELDKTNNIKFQSKNLALVNFYDKELWKQIIDTIALNTNSNKYYHLIGTERYTTPDNIGYLKSLNYQIVYEYFDEINREIFPNLSQMSLDRHELLLKDKDVLVIATSDNLYEKACKYRTQNVIKSLNAVNLGDWKNADEFTPPVMEKILEKNHKIIGFYGSFAPWIDFELIKNLALSRPEYEIVMIGYDYEGGKGAFAKSKIQELENVHIIESQPYNKLKYFSQFFNIAILPFKLTEVTKSVSPVKLFEFMAQGLPVVSTDMQECRKYNTVLIGKDTNEFIYNVDKAISLKDDYKYIASLKETAKENTWETRGKQVLDALKKNIKSKQPILTIGIPCYNMENFITRTCLKNLCVPSLVDDIEIIVIDDGSKDRSSELVNMYNSLYNNKIHLIKKENGGHGSCINSAIKHATGKYFKLVDADDYCDPVALVQHVNYLKSTDVDAIVTNYNRFYDSGVIEPVRFDDKLEEQTYNLEDFITAILKGVKFTSYAHMHSLTFKTALLKDIKITEHSFYVDNEYISYPITNVRTISFQNIYLYQYYLGRPGQSVNPETAKKRSGQNYQIIQNIIKFSENIKNPIINEYILNICFHASIFYVMYADSEDKKDHLLQFWKEMSQENYDYLKNMR